MFALGFQHLPRDLANVNEWQNHVWSLLLHKFKDNTPKIEKMFAHFILQPYHHFLTRARFLARLYVITGRTIAVTTASASPSTSAFALLKMLKFLVKFFKSLYLFNLWMDLVDTLPDFRYWSEVLCCTITTHIGDLQVKVTDFEILSLNFWLKFLEVYIFWSFSLILLILCLMLDTGLKSVPS